MATNALATFNQPLDILPFDPAIGDEVEAAGVAFGDLVETTGMAIAKTQLRLDMNSAATAQALAQTQVDVIAARETIYDDSGNISDQVDHTMKLPLINFIDPVFYEWSHVRLQGQFYAMEVATATEARQKQYTKQSRTGQAGLLVLFGGGQTKNSYSSNTTQTGSESARDTSIGRMRMNSLLRPREDVTVPKPTQVIQGPNIQILQGQFTPNETDGVLQSRQMEVIIQYFTRAGEPIPNKEFSVETGGLSWEYTNPAQRQTDANGTVSITLRRYFADPEADTTPANFIVTVRKGMLNNSTTVQM